MKLIKESVKKEYTDTDGRVVTIMEPEIYQRIYCKNCNNEVDSEEQATGTCSDCGQSWSDTKATDITVKVLELPPMGSDSGE
jgi:Zn finger protein HypA/HybF involved in hydrogenase expression|tara:strand:+ start:3023 stop:3268 length:246 start_codon:yes stop_codon:yes gene_type:complete